MRKCIAVITVMHAVSSKDLRKQKAKCRYLFIINIFHFLLVFLKEHYLFYLCMFYFNGLTDLTLKAPTYAR